MCVMIMLVTGLSVGMTNESVDSVKLDKVVYFVLNATFVCVFRMLEIVFWIFTQNNSLCFCFCHFKGIHQKQGTHLKPSIYESDKNMTLPFI